MQSSSNPSVRPKPFTIPLVGLLVERTTDVLATAAFVLAFGSVLFQVHSYFQGPEVNFLPPPQVLFHFEGVRGEDSSRKFLRIAARMAYANTGTPGHNAALLRESVSFAMKGVTRTLRWHSEVNLTDHDGDGKLEHRYVDGAQSRTINSGSTLSRDVYFVPFPVRCPKDRNCDRDQNFVFIKDGRSWFSEQDEITLTFSYEVFGGGDPKSTKCTIDIDGRVRHDLKELAWATAPCWYRG